MKFFIKFLLVFVIFTQNLFAKTPELVIDQKQINRFIEMIKIIRKNYIYDIDDRKLIDDAINGVLSGLDPHSAYYTKEGYLDVLDRTNGEYGGLGIDILIVDGKLWITKVTKESPASDVGLRVDDNIIEVNGKSVYGMTLSNIKSILKGDVGTFVDLKIMREEEDGAFINSKILDFKIERKVVKIESVESKGIKNDSLYIKINNFSDSTYNDIYDILNKNQNIKGLIVDLRDNGGGLLDQAIKISDGFLESGEIVSVKYKDSSSGTKKYNVSGTSFLNKKVPIILLINNYSASASEIVAGALKDNKAAILVGKATFGKGSVQNIIPLKDGDAIKITSALFYTPSGFMIQGNGVSPDIEVDDLIVKDIRYSNDNIKNENDLEKLSSNNTNDQGIINDSGIVEDKIDDLQFYIAKQILSFEIKKFSS